MSNSQPNSAPSQHAPAQANMYQPQWQPQAQPSAQGSWMLNVLTNIQAARAQHQQKAGAQARVEASVKGGINPPGATTQAPAPPPQPKGQTTTHEGDPVAGKQGGVEGSLGGAATFQSTAPAQSGKKRGRPKGSKNRPKLRDPQIGYLPPHLPLEAMSPQLPSTSQQLPTSTDAKVPGLATTTPAGPGDDIHAPPPGPSGGEPRVELEPQVAGELPAKRRRGKPKGRHLDDHITLKEDSLEDSPDEEY